MNELHMLVLLNVNRFFVTSVYVDYCSLPWDKVLFWIKNWHIDIVAGQKLN